MTSKAAPKYDLIFFDESNEEDELELESLFKSQLTENRHSVKLSDESDYYQQ